MSRDGQLLCSNTFWGFFSILQVDQAGGENFFHNKSWKCCETRDPYHKSTQEDVLWDSYCTTL